MSRCANPLDDLDQLVNAGLTREDGLAEESSAATHADDQVSRSDVYLLREFRFASALLHDCSPDAAVSTGVPGLVIGLRYDSSD